MSRATNPPRHQDAGPRKEAHMKWHTPKIVEIACGCEINAYFPADYCAGRPSGGRA